MGTVTNFATTAEEYLIAEQQKDLVRLVTAGSVDDGKSTLIGRLLYDSQSVYEDQLHAVKRASGLHSGNLELALLTDGLRAEREQGITIDVAYRYFSTAKRKFILADAPGHEQYTRNMATGASNADLGILLLDARHGIQPQSKRHAYIIGLLGIKHLVVAVNKMDLVDFDENVFNDLQSQFRAVIEELSFESVAFFPVSASRGDNVVERSTDTPWFNGSALLEYLETVDVSRLERHQAFRFPVQRVVRPTQDFRGYSGQITSGKIAVGDEVTVLPGLRRTRVSSIVTYDGDLQEAVAPQSVTLRLEDELDISRGDLISEAEDAPLAASSFKAQMIWFAEDPLEADRRYLLKHTTQTTTAEVVVESNLDITSFLVQPASSLRLNDIGVVSIQTARALFFDPYRQNRATGSFILIDPATHNTVAAGMILGATQTEDSEDAGESGIGLGLIINLNGRRSVAAPLEEAIRLKGDEVVTLSRWNQRAAELLAGAQFHVLLLEAPAEVGDVVLEKQGLDEVAVERVLNIIKKI